MLPGRPISGVVSVALYEFVRFYYDIAIQVAPWSAVSAGLAFAGNSDSLAFVNAGWDFDIDDSFPGHGAGTPAFFAGVGNNLSCTSALCAGRYHLEEASSSGDLAGAAAGRTLAGGSSLGGFGAAAFGAGILAGEFDGFFGALCNIVESQLYGSLQIINASGTGAS